MNFSAEVFIFLLLAIGSIAGAVLLIFFRNVVHALVSIVLTFVSIAGIYILLSAEFLAGAQILVYSGAVTIILLFAIMLTKQKDEEPNDKKTNRLKNLIVLISIGAFASILYGGIYNLSMFDEATTLHERNTEQIGILLFSKYIIPFELVSILLLTALIGAIVLARKEETE